MDELLTRVLDVHGGLANWSKVRSASAELAIGSPFVEWRGRLQIYQRRNVRAGATWNDLATKLGIVHAAQPRTPSAGLAVGEEQRRDLDERLDHQHARHQGRARKVALEILLVDRDVLHGHDAASRLVFRDRIHQDGGISVRKTIENERDVHAYGRGHIAGTRHTADVSGVLWQPLTAPSRAA